MRIQGALVTALFSLFHRGARRSFNDGTTSVLLKPYHTFIVRKDRPDCPDHPLLSGLSGLFTSQVLNLDQRVSLPGDCVGIDTLNVTSDMLLQEKRLPS